MTTKYAVGDEVTVRGKIAHIHEDYNGDIGVDFGYNNGLIFVDCSSIATHEAKPMESKLVGLTEEDIAAAIEGRNPELGLAIEKLGAKLAKERRDRGDLRRTRNKLIKSKEHVGEAIRSSDELSMALKVLVPKVYKTAANETSDEIAGDMSAGDHIGEPTKMASEEFFSGVDIDPRGGENE